MDTDTRIFRFLLSAGQRDPSRYYHIEEVAQALAKESKESVSALEVTTAISATRYRMLKSFESVFPEHMFPYDLSLQGETIRAVRMGMFAIKFPQDYGWKGQ